MVQVIKQSTPFGEVAGGFGKGLGETFSDEVGKQFVSRGLGAIDQDVQAGNLTNRLQIFQRLLKIPGMDMDKVQTYMPFVEDMIRRQAIDRQTSGVPGMPTQVPSAGQPGVDQPPIQELQEPEFAPQFTAQGVDQVDRLATMVGPKEREALYTQKMVETPQLRNQVASQLMRDNPGLYLTIDDAMKDASQLIQAQNTYIDNVREVAGAKEKATGEIQSLLKDRTAQILQRNDLSDVWNEMPEEIRLDRERQAIAEGLRTSASPQDLADKYALDTLKDVREYKKLNDLPSVPALGKPSKELLADYNNARRFFSDRNALEPFVSFLQGKGMSEHFARGIAYPLETDQNKTWAKFVKDNPKMAEANAMFNMFENEWMPYVPEVNELRKLSKAAGISLDPTKRETYLADKSKEAATLLADIIKPGTSIGALAVLMNEQGLDDSVLWDEVRERANNGDIKLEGFQESEIATAKPAQPTLTDISLSTGALGSFVERPKYGFWEGVMRRMGK